MPYFTVRGITIQYSTGPPPTMCLVSTTKGSLFGQAKKSPPKKVSSFYPDNKDRAEKEQHTGRGATRNIYVPNPYAH